MLNLDQIESSWYLDEFYVCSRFGLATNLRLQMTDNYRAEEFSGAVTNRSLDITSILSVKNGDFHLNSIVLLLIAQNLLPIPQTCLVSTTDFACSGYLFSTSVVPLKSK